MCQAASWRLELLVDCIPAVSGLLCYKMVCESPRWLTTVGRVEEAEQVLGVVARLNGAMMDSSLVLERAAVDPVLSPRHSKRKGEAIKEEIKEAEKQDGFIQTVKRIMRPSLKAKVCIFFLLLL